MVRVEVFRITSLSFKALASGHSERIHLKCFFANLKVDLVYVVNDDLDLYQ